MPKVLDGFAVAEARRRHNYDAQDRPEEVLDQVAMACSTRIAEPAEKVSAGDKRPLDGDTEDSNKASKTAQEESK